MGLASIPVDLCNPGQVFACLGLMEATEILIGPCEGRFMYRESESQTCFEFSAPGQSIPLETVVKFLSNCKVIALVPDGMQPPKTIWKVNAEPLPRPCCPVPHHSKKGEQESSAVLPVRLRHGAVGIPVEYWIDTRSIGIDNVKFWGGSQGKPGAAIAAELVDAITTFVNREPRSVLQRPFDCSSAMSGSFRLDWRRDYTALRLGFSLNKHKTTMIAVGYPFVELLAAVGLQYARPVRVTHGDSLNYRYYVSNALLPTCLMRVAIGTPELGFPTRRFRMCLDWANQEGQARCIIHTEEESR